MSNTTAELANQRGDGMVISQFSGVDASGEAERLIACLEHSERLPQAVAIRERSYALLKAKPGDRVVDIGCGAGKAVAELQQRGVVVTGIDSSEEMIAHAQHRFPNGDFRRASAEELPFADHSLQGTAPNASTVTSQTRVRR